jgi:RNA polymerase sigma-70 factor (ECF subfamily)
LTPALRRAVQEQFTGRLQRVFLAIAADGIILEALAVELGSSRDAIDKTNFGGRRKLRAALAANA